MALADRVDELVRGLPRDWERARIEVTLDEEDDADRAALLLASASPGRAGTSFTFHLAATDHGAGTSPGLARRVLARLDQAGIRGRVRLVAAERAAPAPVAAEPSAPAAEERTTLAASWDALVGRLPPDWSDLYAEIELDSSDYLDRGALLLAPINPARAAGPSSFRFRAANQAGLRRRRRHGPTRLPAPRRRGSERQRPGPARPLRHERALLAGPRVARGRPRGVTDPGPEVSWKAIERDADVVSAEGAELARVVEIAGDRTADIFNGLVVTFGPLDAKRYLPAERVVRIWPRRVQVDLTAARARPTASLRGAGRRDPAEAGLLQAPLRLARRAVRTWNGTSGKTAASRR